MSKAAKSEVQMDELISLFKSIGLTQAKAREAAKSPKNAAALKDIIENHPVALNSGLDEKQAGLIVTLAGALVKTGGIGHGETELVISKIVAGKLKTGDQISGDIHGRWTADVYSLQCVTSCCQVHGNASGANR